jgi:prepilin-type N-terminal cleavage/methylation domain-containing protein
MTKPVQRAQAGFTLIEMIVSLGLFAVVVTTAVGALMVLISSNTQIQAEQSVMSNLEFALDSMTREIRTGSNYFCSYASSYTDHYPTNIFNTGIDHEAVTGSGEEECLSGPYNHLGVHQRLQGISFLEGGDSITGTVSGAQRILYFYDADTQTIMRRVGNNTPQSIVSSGIAITRMEMLVVGTETFTGPATNPQQPTVSIFIEAKEKDDPLAKTYPIQTTITQRSLDL